MRKKTTQTITKKAKTDNCLSSSSFTSSSSPPPCPGARSAAGSPGARAMAAWPSGDSPAARSSAAGGTTRALPPSAARSAATRIRGTARRPSIGRHGRRRHRRGLRARRGGSPLRRAAGGAVVEGRGRGEGTLAHGRAVGGRALRTGRRPDVAGDGRGTSSAPDHPVQELRDMSETPETSPQGISHGPLRYADNLIPKVPGLHEDLHESLVAEDRAALVQDLDDPDGGDHAEEPDQQAPEIGRGRIKNVEIHMF